MKQILIKLLVNNLLIIFFNLLITNFLDLNPNDAAMILASFCRLKIIKIELFEILEYNFVKKLSLAEPKAMASYAFTHSRLCNEMQMKFFENKK